MGAITAIDNRARLAARGEIYALDYPRHVFSSVLTADTNKSFTVPTDANYVMFSANGDFYVGYDEAATVPSGDTVDGTAQEMNPSIRYIAGLDLSIGELQPGPGNEVGNGCTDLNEALPLHFLIRTPGDFLPRALVVVQVGDQDTLVTISAVRCHLDAALDVYEGVVCGDALPEDLEVAVAGNIRGFRCAQYICIE